jgi:hypothetical protein
MEDYSITCTLPEKDISQETTTQMLWFQGNLNSLSHCLFSEKDRLKAMV